MRKDLTEYPMPWWSVPFWIAVGVLWGGLLLALVLLIKGYELACFARRLFT